MLRKIGAAGGLLLAMCTTGLHAQDTLSFHDDELFKKDVYKNVRADMEKGLVKGFTQLWQENMELKPEKIAVPYKKAQTAKSLPRTAVAKQLNDQVFVIWKFFRKTNENIEGIAVDATAFALNDEGVMVTNHHVFSKLLDKYAKFYEMDSTLFLSDLNGNIYGIDKILTYNENADLALFTVKNLHAAKINGIAIGKDAPVGADVNILSHPTGFPYYFSTGVVARNVKYSEFGGYTERMDITADYAVGSSGGPIVDAFGSLIGVVSSTHSIYAREQQNLQMVVKQAIPARSLFSMIQ
ncbi:Trypsin-like peptidase domain-containing protein [Filimonas lacunae]|uniref:Trypsin-like peptidase domain-containing protein n=1 Tax=Filimonas lacunae TaxID=477680 RepID=A0A173MJ87_9BACT|nr:serine protease [Filimonas lacunae]BAV07537.1 serine protease [Filimonas lacunae]SIT30033.1 Trypsin-like peptidase domain-containing protein [Filimonas lacunae]